MSGSNNDNNAARRAALEPYQDSQVGSDAHSGLTDMSSNFPSSMDDTLAMSNLSNLSDLDENTDPLNPEAPRRRASMPDSSARLPLSPIYPRPVSSHAAAIGPLQGVPGPSSVPMAFGYSVHPSAYGGPLSRISEEELENARRLRTEERANRMDEPIVRDDGVMRPRVGLTRPMGADAEPAPRHPRLRFVTPDNAHFHPELESLVDIFQEIRRTKRDNVLRAFTTVACPGQVVNNMKRSQHPENRRMAKLLHRVTKPSDNVARRRRNYLDLKAFLRRVERELSILDPTRSRPIATAASSDADDNMDEADIVDSDTESDESGENDENIENVETAPIAVDAAVSPILIEDEDIAQREVEWQMKHDLLEAHERHLARVRNMLVVQAREFRTQLDEFVARHAALSQDETRVRRNRNRTSISLSPSLLRRSSLVSIPSPQAPLGWLALHSSLSSSHSSHSTYSSHPSQDSPLPYPVAQSPEDHSDDEGLEMDAAAVQ
ncbi:hypothetical protein BC940DRAFT_316611 [Gongronella butleri]|nr:hypothetical protein BC940DRAFT_316611 [Gongronella butleri]